MGIHDIQILRRLRANDRAAFAEVVERHYRPIYRQLWHLCGDADTAADLTQETFVQAWKSLRTFEGRSALHTWLYTIAVRVWRRTRDDSRTTYVPLDEIAETLSDPMPGPPEAFTRHALQEEVQDALLALPAAYRETLVLFYLQGLKYHEIAEALDIPLGTVKSRLHAGLKRMKAVLETAAGREIIR
jgi:RNA polymerase sigma-70 factor (ECF subfamily)